MIKPGFLQFYTEFAIKSPKAETAQAMLGKFVDFQLLVVT